MDGEDILGAVGTFLAEFSDQNTQGTKDLGKPLNSASVSPED